MYSTEPAAAGAASTDDGATRPGDFVAVNYITCQDGYRERFEYLFRPRAHAIERAPGFKRMSVLQPDETDGDYLIISVWESRAAFDNWRTSPEFAAGHQRGFADLRQARENGEAAPMSSRMVTYKVLTD